MSVALVVLERTDKRGGQTGRKQAGRVTAARPDKAFYID
jgi:hypothetical protein